MTRPNTDLEKDNEYFTDLIKFDMQEDRIAEIISFGQSHIGGEVQFQQREGSDPLKDEDDGYIMTAVHNWKTNQSQFVMWDAKTCKVVLKADLDTRVPIGFHTTFVHESDY